MFKNNSIIITNNENKTDILKNLNKELLNIKIYTLTEFKKLYYFDYSEETIYYVMTTKKVLFDTAKLYINNLYNIEDKTYTHKKLNDLVSLKKELITKGLLTSNKLFRNSIKNKTIYFYNLTNTIELNILKEELQKLSEVITINNNTNNFPHQIYSFTNIEEEVVFIANKICELVKEGIKLSDIYITNINDEYRSVIERIFPMFNLPITLSNTNNLYSTHLSHLFFKYYNEDLNQTLEELKTNVLTPETEDIYNMILNIINKYIFIDDKEILKDILKEEFKTTILKRTDNKNSIHEVSINKILTDNEYLILPGFNTGSFPTTYKNEDYLSDNEKKELGNVSLTKDLNEQAKEEAINELKNKKNILITYRIYSDENDELAISNLNEELNYEVIDNYEYNYQNSDIYNQIELTKLRDDYEKFGTTSIELKNLYNHYKDNDYKTYNNKFTGIDKVAYKEFKNNKLTLSYSSLDNFFKCPFKYYLSNILYVDKFQDNFNTSLGNVFHHVLEHWQDKDFDLDKLYEEGIKNEKYEFTPSDKYYLKKLKPALANVIETLKRQETYTKLNEEEYEHPFIINNLSDDMNVSFYGRVDKIKYNSETKILAVIDYKTNGRSTIPVIDVNSIEDGLHLQLPIYLYLIHNDQKFKDMKLAGFYIQTILLPPEANEKNPEEARKKDLKLRGYTNNNIDIMSELDSTYQDSSYIASLGLTKEGEFKKSAKVLSDKEIEETINKTDNIIKQAVTKIENADFTITPVKVINNGKLVENGCDYCNYRDICFVNNGNQRAIYKKTEKEGEIDETN